MYALRELITTPQDLARYEYAICVYNSDDPDIYNVVPDSTPSRYTTEAAAEHVRWAWRQSPTIGGDIGNAIMVAAKELSAEFKGFVLLTASEARWKVARIACAIASLCYASEVNEYHVAVAKGFIQGIYNDSRFAFRKYATAESVGGKGLVDYLNKLGSESVMFMYEHDSFNTEMIDTIVEGKSTRREFFKVLTLSNKCLVRGKNGYVKTQGFKDFLNDWRSSR
jgi:hypothetical protein